MKKLAVVVVVLALIVFGGTQAFSWANYQVTTPVSQRSHKVSFTIEPGEGVPQIADALQAKGLVRNSEIFQLYLRFTNQRSAIEAGSYLLSPSMTMAQIAGAIKHGVGQQGKITIPEGYTAKKIADLVQQSGFGSAQDYLKAEQDPTWHAQYPFLKGLPAGRDLEGYLFPDTYLLSAHATPRDLIKRQLAEFSSVFGPAMVQAAAQPIPGVRGPETVDQIVILASIVEREANSPSDRPLVCDVYYNRLSQGMPLQADATVLFAEGVWKKQVLNQDLQYQSPYNTYLHPGLPPGPISNPGQASIEACIHPTKSAYLYYFTDPHGKTHFAATLDQFNQEKNQYGVA